MPTIRRAREPSGPPSRAATSNNERGAAGHPSNPTPPGRQHPPSAAAIAGLRNLFTPLSKTLYIGIRKYVYILILYFYT